MISWHQHIVHLYTDSRTAIRLLLSSGVDTAFTSISFFVTCAVEMISTAKKELFFNLFHVLLRRDLNEIAVSHLPCLRKLVKHHNKIVLLISVRQAPGAEGHTRRRGRQFQEA